MTYAETLDYLYNALPMFSRMGSAAFKKDLTNVRLLCDHLGNPQNRFRSVHVAGTNGKGSVSHMLAAVFQQCGYKTGLYTSPHLYDFRERIRLNGQMIPEGFVVDFVSTVKPLIESVEPSFFEITVAMAFQFFAQQAVDMAVIEVGLGGRLDSTNIIQPELSVITNIGWDHTNLLGNSLPEIAAEKAGIIKPNVPVVVGESLPETRPVFESVATEKNALLIYAEETYRLLQHRMNLYCLKAVYQKGEEQFAIETDLPGIYQTKNLRTALTTIDELRKLGWQLPAEKIREALAKVKSLTGLGGRWEAIHQNPTVVLDVAHNKNGIEQLLFHLSQLTYGRLHLVFGMVKDKEPALVLNLLPADARYYFTQADSPRALPVAELKETAAQWNLFGEGYADVNQALKAAIKTAAPDDLIVVCGSIFLVAEVDKALL